jgi:C4-dicarboxylate transporter, DctM subunit
MDSTTFAAVIAAALFISILVGIPIMVSLGAISFLGVAYLMSSFDVAGNLLAGSAYGAIRSYVFVTIPMFILLGEILSRSGAAADVFNLVNRLLRRLPGRLALATVGGNTVFGAVTGVSIASAAAFSRIAYPEMVRARYNKSVALGTIAGSSALGMLIPPSILLIVWGVISQQSIGRLFVAGVIPGLLLASMFVLFLVAFAALRPHLFGEDQQGNTTDAQAVGAQEEGKPHRSDPRELVGAVSVCLLIIFVLGGIWFGMFTPTEAAGMGALMAIGIGILKGMGWRDFVQSILNTGRISAPLLFLLIAAQLYSRLLAMGGIIEVVEQMFLLLENNAFTVLLIMVAVWLFMGMLMDSVSIILLTVPLFAPIANSFGIDPLAFAVIGIIAIEAGLLTPPFGICVFTVKSCVTDPSATLYRIFVGSTPFWLMLLLLALLVAVFPGIATWLPTQMN